MAKQLLDEESKENKKKSKGKKWGWRNIDGCGGVSGTMRGGSVGSYWGLW
jgi:hypothetical protein